MQQHRQDLASSLEKDVHYLASDALEGRATGTPGNAAARQYLVDRLTDLGARPLFGDSLIDPFTVSVRESELEANNIVGVFTGEATLDIDQRPMLVLTAHYDHLGVRDGKVHNGADDNASGVSALLALAERLNATPTQHDVVIALLDAEELGLRGARHLAAALEPRISAVTLNVNLDMVGRSDAGELYVAGSSHSPALKPLVERAKQGIPIAVELGHDTGSGPDNWTMASDHAAFHQLGVPFLYLGVEDHPDYHRPTDDTDKVDFAFLAATVDLVWNVIRIIDKAGLPLTESPRG